MSTHFTAVVKVTKTVNQPESQDRYNNRTAAVHEVAELANFVIREDTLEAVLTKANAHLALTAPAPTQIAAKSA